MSAKLEVGDTVKLKSGGPIMTVGKLEDDVNDATKKNAFAFCSWFDGKKLVQKTFPVDMLKLVDT